MTDTAIFTVGCVSSSAFGRQRLVSRSRVVGSIDLTLGQYQRYQKCLQLSKSRKISTSRVHFDQNKLVRWCHKEASFRSYNSPVVDTHSISLIRYWFIVMQRHHILMRELENGITRSEPNVPSFGIDIACCGLIKVCLTL